MCMLRIHNSQLTLRVSVALRLCDLANCLRVLLFLIYRQIAKLTFFDLYKSLSNLS